MSYIMVLDVVCQYKSERVKPEVAFVRKDDVHDICIIEQNNIFNVIGYKKEGIHLLLYTSHSKEDCLSYIQRTFMDGSQSLLLE